MLTPDSDISDDEHQDDRYQVEEITVPDTDEESDGKSYHEQKEVDFEDDNNIITQELHVNGFSDEKLRFLVQNTTPDGGRFFLSSLIRGGGFKAFTQSEVCGVLLGKIPVSNLKEVYLHCKYLTSFYCMGRNYPYS